MMDCVAVTGRWVLYDTFLIALTCSKLHYFKDICVIKNYFISCRYIVYKDNVAIVSHRNLELYGIHKYKYVVNDNKNFR